jgi:hypothetical protein
MSGSACRGLATTLATNADEVVVTFSRHVRDAYLSGRVAKLRKKHPGHKEVRMLEWETRKPFGIARIGKLDPRLLNVAATLPQRIGHGLDHPESLLANGEVDEQNPGACYAAR